MLMASPLGLAPGHSQHHRPDTAAALRGQAAVDTGRLLHNPSCWHRGPRLAATSSLTGLGGWKMLTAPISELSAGGADGLAASGQVLRELLLLHGVPMHHLWANHAGRLRAVPRGTGLPRRLRHVDDVDVSNLTVAVLADTPPLMADGNWRVGLFMDAVASQQQADKLGAVFAGQLGGPMAMLAPLIGEMLGGQTAPIDYSEDEDFVPPLNPEGEVEKLTGMFHPANSTLTIARATASRVDAFGLQFDNSGKNGHSAPFSWAA